jgi:hypothetical protein
MPVKGVGATTCKAGSAFAAGAGAGAAGGVGAGLAAAGAARAGGARRGGLGAGRGAVTMTSGSVSDAWPLAGSGKVNAPSATAPSRRRVQAEALVGVRESPNAPNTTPLVLLLPGPILGALLSLSRYLLANRIGTFGNVAFRLHRSSAAPCNRTALDLPPCSPLFPTHVAARQRKSPAKAGAPRRTSVSAGSCRRTPVASEI